MEIALAYRQAGNREHVGGDIIDVVTSVLRYASAAHEPVVICEPGRPAYELGVTAPILALFLDPGELFGESSLKVERHTLLVAATDGLRADYPIDIFSTNFGTGRAP